MLREESKPAVLRYFHVRDTEMKTLQTIAIKLIMTLLCHCRRVLTVGDHGICSMPDCLSSLVEDINAAKGNQEMRKYRLGV